MFSSISWQSYISTIAVLLVIYYAFVLYLYYRKDIAQMLTSGRNKDKGRENDDDYNEKEAAIHLSDEVKALIHQAGYSRLSKGEIIVSLQQLLSAARFDTAQTPGLKERLGKIITYECQANCSMHLDEGDLEQVWVGK